MVPRRLSPTYLNVSICHFRQIYQYGRKGFHKLTNKIAYHVRPIGLPVANAGEIILKLCRVVKVFKDRVLVEEIYGYMIFKWTAVR